MTSNKIIFEKITKKILFDLFLSLFLIFLLSLFLSFKKFWFLIFPGLLFFFFKKNYKNIIIINICFLILLLKAFFIFFDPTNLLTKTIYEKNFLYGVKNINLSASIYGGDLNPKNKKNIKKITIKTDDLGFRNTINYDDSNYIMVGDSFIHNTRISHENLINEILNRKTNKKFYNASLSSQDIGHYLETSKYFKKKKYKGKIIMFVFSGNDFLKYGKIQNQYANKLDNKYLRFYFEIKKYFDFYSKIKFISEFFKKNKFEETVDKNQKIGEFNVYFYQPYYIEENINLNFSKEFDIYKNVTPDVIVVIPTKAEVYCEFLENYSCPEIKYRELFGNLEIFKDQIIIDSTNYLQVNAKEKLKQNELIFDNYDTHLNEIGLEILSDFVIKKLRIN